MKKLILVLVCMIFNSSASFLEVNQKAIQIYKLMNVLGKYRDRFYIANMLIGNCDNIYMFDCLDNYKKYKSDIENDLGNTDIMMAINEKNQYKVCLLAAFDNDINKQSNLGYTALMLACMSGCKDIIKTLLQVKSINLDLQNYNGKTALMIAIELGNKYMAKKIIKAKADLDKKDIDGKTASMIATELGILEISQLLLNIKEPISCVICHEDIIIKDDAYRMLSCNHLFDENCIESWIKKCQEKSNKPTCPICRAEID